MIEIVSSCQDPIPHPFRKGKNDLNYAQDQNPEHDFDIVYLPGSITPTPLIIWVHGGGFDSGNKGKEDHVNAGRALTGLGFASAGINYRLATDTENKFPAAISDVRCAVRYFKKNALTYNIDPDKIFVIGFSAGGNLAGLLGTAPNDSRLDDGICPHDGYNPSVKAVITMWSPHDLTRIDLFSEVMIQKAEKYLGLDRGDPEFEERAELASPYYHASSESTSFLLIHSINDPIVPYELSDMMKIILSSAGVDAELVTKQSSAHFDIIGYGPISTDPIEYDPTETDPESIRTGFCTIINFLHQQTIN